MFSDFLEVRLKGCQLSWDDVQSFTLRAQHCSGDNSEEVKLARRIDQAYRMQIAKEDDERMQKFVAALRCRNKDEAGRCLRRENSSWALFSELDHAGLAEEVSSLPSWGLLYLASEARGHILRISNSGDFDFRELIPMGKIVECLKRYLDTRELSKCRAARVNDLVATLEAAQKHVASTMSERTRKGYIEEFGAEAAAKIFGDLGVPFVNVTE